MNLNYPPGRHTGEGRYPDDQKIPTQVGLHHDYVRFAEIFSLLDTGLRRYDVAFLMENPA
jgi:hypothetical protein